MSAARSPPRSEPANSQALRPRAMPRRARSAALLVRQMRPSLEEAREGIPALQHVVHGLGDVGMPRELGALGRIQCLQVGDERSNALPADGALIGRSGH